MDMPGMDWNACMHACMRAPDERHGVAMMFPLECPLLDVAQLAESLSVDGKRTHAEVLTYSTFIHYSQNNKFHQSKSIESTHPTTSRYTSNTSTSRPLNTTPPRSQRESNGTHDESAVPPTTMTAGDSTRRSSTTVASWSSVVSIRR